MSTIMTRAVVGAVLTALVMGVPRAGAQPTVTFEQMVLDLSSDQPGIRLIAAAALKQSAYPEAAAPLAKVIVDPEDAIQLEAIAGELNVYLAEKVNPRRRVGMIVEVRNRISAESVFSAGPAAIEPRPVPPEVVTALRTASHDENPRVALEAMYAFGVLASELTGRARQEVLAASASELAAALGVPETNQRTAAIRVIARVYGVRQGDRPVNETVGDAVVLALNDRSSRVRELAMGALGALRYERGVQALVDIVQHHQRGATAAAALDGLAHIGHPSSQALVTEALASRDATLRRIAVEALARSGSPDNAVRVSSAMVSERDQEVLLAGHFASVLLSDGSVDQLVEGLARARLREQAFGYLLEVAPGRGQTIGVHIQDPDARVRLDLLDVLGASGDERAISAVERLLRDPDPTVARAAARAAARLRAAAATAP